MGFMHLKIKIKEKFKLKTKTHQNKNLKISSMQVMQNLFSFQTQFKFLYQLAQETFFHLAFKEKHKKRGKDCLVI